MDLVRFDALWVQHRFDVACWREQYEDERTATECEISAEHSPVFSQITLSKILGTKIMARLLTATAVLLAALVCTTGEPMLVSAFRPFPSETVWKRFLTHRGGGRACECLLAMMRPLFDGHCTARAVCVRELLRL